jgi:putative endopeptidase
LEMTQRIEQAMEEEINGLSWMSPQTRQQALLKLHTIVNKIGYPDNWRDYSSVGISHARFLGNVAHATMFESRRALNKIGKPPDRTEWMMPTPTVDAYYNAQMNDINFPAGVLQPPLYDPKMDDPPNYGDTGSTIGHELTHGFTMKAASSTRAATCATGGESRTRPSSTAEPVVWPTSTRSTPSWTTSRSTAA